MDTGVAAIEKYKMHIGGECVDAYRAVSNMSPFGGYKRSGIGRESGQEMIKEYLLHKSIWIETSNAEAPKPVHIAVDLGAELWAS